MTARAWIIGVLLALALAWFGYYNDAYMRATYVVGNHLPASVFGVLILFVLLINPLLRLTRVIKPLKGVELALILALMSVVCVIPGSGFLRTFAPTLTMPHHWEKQIPSWVEAETLSYAPPGVLVETGGDDSRVVEAFVDGMRRSKQGYSPSRVPWDAWLPTLRLWLPLFFLMTLATMGMALILHRQWSTHEHLSYPIARFAAFVFGEGGEGSGIGSIVRSRLFWWGFLPVFLIHVNNGIDAYIPKWPGLPLEINLWPLGSLWPAMTVQDGANGIFGPRIHFVAIAFAYFLPGEVTFSLGISTLCAIIMGAAAMEHGLRISVSRAGAGNMQGLQFGAHAGMVLMILYTGRSYFRKVLKAGLGFRRVGENVEDSSVWGFRLLVVSGVAATWLMTRMGLTWPIALAMLLIILSMYTVLARMTAETGLFFLQAWWQPGGVLLGFMGAVCLGPQMLMVAVLISVVLTVDPRECLMPFLMNVFRLCEDHKIRLGRIAVSAAILLALGLVGGTAVSLVLQYNDGANTADWWANSTVPKMAPDLVTREVEEMTHQGTLDRAVQMGPWERFFHMKVDEEFVVTVFIGFSLFLGCAFARLRFPRWPIHPVIFLVWLTYPGRQFSASFLIGWAIKAAVVGFAGVSVYRRYRPVAVGVIAGAIMAALVFMIVAALYYVHHGYPAPAYRVFPG